MVGDRPYSLLERNVDEGVSFYSRHEDTLRVTRFCSPRVPGESFCHRRWCAAQRRLAVSRAHGIEVLVTGPKMEH